MLRRKLRNNQRDVISVITHLALKTFVAAGNYFAAACRKDLQQEWAELCQAQFKLEVIVYIWGKVEVEIVVEAGIQLLARVMLNLNQVEV